MLFFELDCVFSQKQCIISLEHYQVPPQLCFWVYIFNYVFQNYDNLCVVVLQGAEKGCRHTVHYRRGMLLIILISSHNRSLRSSLMTLINTSASAGPYDNDACSIRSVVQYIRSFVRAGHFDYCFPRIYHFFFQMSSK